MPDSAPPTSQSPDNVSDIPRFLRAVGVMVSVAEVILGSLALFLALRYGGRRSVAVIVVMAVLLLAYAVLRYWQRYEEHPDRGRPGRRDQPP